MAEAWHTFPAQMGEHRAFITFNEAYAREADSDPRDILLKVRAEIKKPNAAGMPTDEEFPALASLDERLENQFGLRSGSYVGKVTVNGKRHFLFYVSCSEETASRAVERISDQTSYNLAYSYEKDAAKEAYWRDLYPTPDDWQMIKDLGVLDALRDRGDKSEKSREVTHWAYFQDDAAAKQFSDWAAATGYSVAKLQPPETERQSKVRFTHCGTMILEDITHHSITIGRKVRELGGEYDGWETSV